MRTRPRRSDRPTAALLALASLVSGGLLAAGGASGATPEEPTGAEGWQGLLGSRPLPELGGAGSSSSAPRRSPTGARGRRRASEVQMRVWTTAARDAQQRAIARLAFRGIPVSPSSPTCAC